MKLRNKKTGEIIELLAKPSFVKRNDDYLQSEINSFNSLTELNAEWEDYEEKPKDNEYYYIDDLGRIQFSSEVLDEVEEHPNNWMVRKSFGNYFSSREEAKKAVEKLKAWKRLKGKGFRFTGINDDEDSQELITQCGILCEADIYHLGKDADFLLIFGGEE